MLWIACLQDGGGVTKDGGLPPAPILSVSGERELTHELEAIINALNKGAAVDWEKRYVLFSFGCKIPSASQQRVPVCIQQTAA